MLTLRYDEPAPGREGHVLPIGNRALGACVSGTLSAERVQFNEKWLWTGGPGIGERGSMAPEEVAAIRGNPPGGRSGLRGVPELRPP
ncbi:glycoside hydrolase N-terminal domain-containing protein [Nonomuraea sp. NPDC049684]|uniref:glycoside hydrolase N-terminal domain-containing protein n=1 Tax=Nonomuraea sp. NPDC049684 TaxID=3364356 RepID=UPI00379E17B0